jgi:hypothetical protein
LHPVRGVDRPPTSDEDGDGTGQIILLKAQLMSLSYRAEPAAAEGPAAPLSCAGQRVRVLHGQSNATTRRTPSSPKRPARAFITANTCAQ